MRADKNSISYKIAYFLGQVIAFVVFTLVVLPVVIFLLWSVFQAAAWVGSVLLP